MLADYPVVGWLAQEALLEQASGNAACQIRNRLLSSEMAISA
jgi:hypothetical protein